VVWVGLGGLVYADRRQQGDIREEMISQVVLYFLQCYYFRENPSCEVRLDNEFRDERNLDQQFYNLYSDYLRKTREFLRKADEITSRH
jgi:hypothetical protein